MESKYINRYHTFCKSLKNMKKVWMQMLRARNQLAHDYDGTFAAQKFQDIINNYYPLFIKLKENVRKYYQS